MSDEPAVAVLLERITALETALNAAQAEASDKAARAARSEQRLAEAVSDAARIRAAAALSSD